MSVLRLTFSQNGGGKNNIFFQLKSLLSLKSHLFQNYDTIYVRFFSHVYLQSFLLHDICAFFGHVYLRSFLLCGVFITSIWPFSYKQAYICAQKSPCICVTNKHVYVGSQNVVVWEALNYTVSEKLLHVRWNWKVTSVWVKLGRNGRVNFEQGLVLIHCPHSSGGCWLPDNGFVGIRGLSLERLCTLFHKCWPKQRSIQLEISVRQAKHDS